METQKVFIQSLPYQTSTYVLHLPTELYFKQIFRSIAKMGKKNSWLDRFSFSAKRLSKLFGIGNANIFIQLHFEHTFSLLCRSITIGPHSTTIYDNRICFVPQYFIPSFPLLSTSSQWWFLYFCHTSPWRIMAHKLYLQTWNCMCACVILYASTQKP